MTKKIMMNLDMSRIPARYSGKWVALSFRTNKVIKSGGTAQEVFNKYREEKDVVITRIPEKNYSYLL